ncbi:MAG: DUF4097 family beta strand repeat-containing protein [Candidatus Poribacteria bacterium]|nr:DUF4097 family beta strand repeat-containing protein [Candidatus Poribacteria bacterium]
MEEQRQEQQQELRGLFQMLDHTAKIAEDAALTGAFSGGETRCITQFNNVLARLKELNAVPDGLFDELDAEASFGQIGIACHQLAAYLNDGLDTTTDAKGWFASVFGERFMENLAEEAIDKPLGDMIRKAVPDFLTETTLEDIVETFPVAAGGKLTIDADCGGIDVQSTADDTVSVRIQRAAQIKTNRRAAEILKNLDVQITHEGSDVKIEAKFTGNAKRWQKRKNDLDVQFDILVPQHYNLDLQTACDDISAVNVTGDVNVETFRAGLRLQDITGRIDAVTSIGNIDLKAFNGDVVLQTTGGNIAIAAGSGDVKAETSGGNVQAVQVIGAVNGQTSGGNVILRGCQGGAELKTAGGSIEVENDGPVLAKASGGSIRCQLQKVATNQNLLLDLETTGGSINVSLVPDIAATVEAKVLSGSVTTEFPVTVEASGTVKPDQLRGVINGGGPLLKLRSVGGNIVLRKTEEENSTEV